MSNKSVFCKTFIKQDDFDYICAEKVNFIVFIAGIFFVIFIILTVVGNSLVILAIFKDKRLRTPSNYLILSLAVTDLIVGLITVPWRAFQDLRDYGTWPYGALLCDLRVVIDRLCVDASIFHLLAIAIDRFLCVTSVRYSVSRNGKRIALMVGVVWFAAFLLAIAAFAGWRDDKYEERIAQDICFVSTAFSLNLTVLLVIFTIPVILMTILYIRVYQIAKKNIRYKPGNSSDASSTNHSQNQNIESSVGNQNESKVSFSASESSESAAADIKVQRQKPVTIEIKRNTKKFNPNDRREKKVARTLFIITACVILCWFPFFTYYALTSIFDVKFASDSNFFFNGSLWLGYLNSLLNPIIYAATNTYYRDAFKKILKIK
ncbi:5-hydroxytryptamine receptor-like protein [Dinothrombium tinctorium]|uniref:5-hydroxytryptamine receptor-like protein n=1 Tax=Dinothrombium tinctorium TaxID=1965070 RepID=A0A3S3P331_9ACAR|nr:5-hydroxytryptamine receptor-like protein [Dinothrombium tinctorium]